MRNQNDTRRAAISLNGTQNHMQRNKNTGQIPAGTEFYRPSAGPLFTAVMIRVAPRPNSASSNVAGRLIAPKTGVNNAVTAMEPEYFPPAMTFAL